MGNKSLARGIAANVACSFTNTNITQEKPFPTIIFWMLCILSYWKRRQISHKDYDCWGHPLPEPQANWKQATKTQYEVLATDCCIYAHEGLCAGKQCHCTNEIYKEKFGLHIQYRKSWHLLFPSINLETTQVHRGWKGLLELRKKSSSHDFTSVPKAGCSGTVVKVLCYKSEDRWFDSRWCHWNFSLT